MVDEIGTFTPEQARLIWHDYLARTQLPGQIQKHYPQRRTPDIVSPHRVHVQNLSGETVPAFGCMQITGTADVGAKTALTITKPTSTDGDYIFNGPYAIADTETGWGYRHGVVLMLGDAPTVAGAQYVPIVASWEIEEDSGPFVVYGADQTNARTLVGRIAASGGSGAPILIGDISTADCPAATLEIATTAPAWFTGGCDDIPGEAYSVVEVTDPLGIMGPYTQTELEAGMAVAVYTYPVDDCQNGVWVLLATTAISGC